MDCKQNPNAALDFVKCCAAFAVNLSHACMKQRYKYGYYRSKKLLSYWGWANFWCSFGRIGTHLFMMVTGLLMLSPKRLKDSETSTLKYVFRRLIQYVFWSIPYHRKRITDGLKMKTKFLGIKNIIEGFFISPGTLWYLQVVMRILLFVPFVRQAIQATTRKTLEFSIIALWITHHCVKTFLTLMKCLAGNDFFFSVYLSFLLGHYFWTIMEYQKNPHGPHPKWAEEDGYFHSIKRINWQSSKTGFTCALIFISSCLLNFGLTIISGHYFKNPYFGNLYQLYSSLIPVSYVSFFCMVYSFASNWAPTTRPEKILASFTSSVGSCTFGVYLFNEYFIHAFVTEYLFPIKLKIDFLKMNPRWFCPLIAVLGFLVTWIATCILKRIPVLKKLVA